MRHSKLSVAVSSATLFLGAVRADPPAAADAIPLPALAPPSGEPHALTPQEQAAVQRRDETGSGMTPAAPATTLYHVVVAFRELMLFAAASDG